MSSCEDPRFSAPDLPFVGRPQDAWIYSLRHSAARSPHLGRSSSMPNHWGNSSSLMDSDRLSADAPNQARPFLLYVSQGGRQAHLPLVRHRRALGPPSGGCVPWLSVVT